MTFLQTDSQQNADCLRCDVMAVSVLLPWESAVVGSICTDGTGETVAVTLLRMWEETEFNSGGIGYD